MNFATKDTKNSITRCKPPGLEKGLRKPASLHDFADETVVLNGNWGVISMRTYNLSQDYLASIRIS